MTVMTLWGLWIMSWIVGLTLGTAVLYKIGMPLLRYLADINLIRREG